MRLADIVIDIPTKSLDGTYTYVLPADVPGHEPHVGSAVVVPFGPRRVIGFIVGVREADATDADKKLKGVIEVVSKSFFDELGAECARFLAERYVAPLSVCVRLFTPPGAVPKVVQGALGAWRIESPSVGEVDDRWVTLGDIPFQPKSNAVKQIAVMDTLRRGDIKISELNSTYGNVSAAVAALEKKGALRVERRRRVRTGMPAAMPASESVYRVDELPLDLTCGQEQALSAIHAAYDAACGEVVLVDGVTGSGKTEVYLQAIARALAEGKSAIVLVPEISLTPQTVARFRGRFGDAIAVLHSRMSAGERYDQWDLIRAGEARVVIGARSALFAPLQNLGLIIIDEEHETSYKQESAPRYVARDVAEWMMRRRGGALVLGSATPSIEALYQAHTRPSWHVVSMPERANGRPLPQVEVIDMADEFRSGAREMFSARLRRALIGELEAGHKAVLLLNQRGFARFLLCRDCGFVPKCTSCSTTLTYHDRGNRLICHHCGYSVAAPPACPSCASPYLKKFGVGTQRVEDELRALLAAELGEDASVPVIRMDADTTAAKGSHRRLLEQFASEARAVLLGTQMIAKGLDFDDVTLVGVINADTQLHMPDFRAAERTFDLIEQVAGRAGRGELPGRVMVQTYEADSVAIRAAALYDRDMFLRSELPKRRVLKYPPYVRMANVLTWGKDEHAVRACATLLREQICARVRESDLIDWEVLPASPCVFERIRNDFRWHVIVKCPHDGDVSAVLHDIYRGAKPAKGVNVAIDVDPIDLL